jgi:hypothetical protein
VEQRTEKGVTSTYPIPQYGVTQPERPLLIGQEATMGYDSAPPARELPVPQWATWIASRSPSFKMHNSLGMAKNAVSAKGHIRGSGRTELEEAWVYSLAVINDEVQWVERFHILAGDIKEDHPFWKVKPKGRPVSEAAVAAAIASITGVSERSTPAPPAVKSDH